MWKSCSKQIVIFENVKIKVVDDDGVQKSVKGQYSCEPFFTETAENGDMTLDKIKENFMFFVQNRQNHINMIGLDIAQKIVRGHYQFAYDLFWT